MANSLRVVVEVQRKSPTDCSEGLAYECNCFQFGLCRFQAFQNTAAEAPVTAIAATALRAMDKTDTQTNRAPNLSKARADATHPNTIQSIDFLSYRRKKAPWISPRGEVTNDSAEAECDLCLVPRHN